MAGDRKKPGKDRRLRSGDERPGAEHDETCGEPTLVGKENWRDLPSGPLVWERERQRHRMQSRGILGLMSLLGVVLPLGVLAMTGVGLGWFTPIFALEVLALIITPCFTGWLLVVKWAFGPDGRPR